jgi:hypothetical protein
MSSEQIIINSIEIAQEKGIKIKRGALFSWHGCKLISCDCSGAVLVAYAEPFQSFPKGWLKVLFTILECDHFWWRRFDYGFNQQNIMYKRISDTEYEEDSVSKFAMQLSKRVI